MNETDNFTVTMSDMPIVAPIIEDDKPAEEAEPQEVEAETKIEDEKPREKSRAQKRIETLIQEKHDLQRQLSEAKSSRPPSEEPEELDPDDFDDYDDYLEAVENKPKAQAKKEAKKEELNPFAETLEQIEAKFDDTREKHSDFDDKVRGMPILTEAMLSAINESDEAGEVAYYLANNPDEAEKLAKMSPSKMAITIGKIEYKLQNPIKEEVKQPPKQKQTQAPEPITPVGGAGEYTKPLEEMSFAEFEKVQNAKANDKKFW